MLQIFFILCIVTENQGQGIVTAPVAAKQQPTTPFSVSAQSFNRLGWNPDVKAKQEEVSKYLKTFGMSYIHKYDILYIESNLFIHFTIYFLLFRFFLIIVVANFQDIIKHSFQNCIKLLSINLKNSYFYILFYLSIS